MTEQSARRRAAELARRYAGADGAALLRPLIEREFPGRIAVVSSFGAESAVLLALVAGIDPATPVIFLETGKLFPETLAYRDRLAARLGLRDVRGVAPDPADLAARDGDGSLWRRDADLCCHLRKVLPLERALAGFEAWITGRKRYQGHAREHLPVIEAVDGRIKVNPLATWSRARIEAAFESAGLIRHPLSSHGYPSIGCVPCTRPAPGQAPRAGRWPESAKTECGIHWPNGRLLRSASPPTAPSRRSGEAEVSARTP